MWGGGVHPHANNKHGVWCPPSIPCTMTCSFVSYVFSNGVGRTGTFIAIHTQLERFKTEKEADLFQYIKSTRLQRAGMVLDAVSVEAWS